MYVQGMHANRGRLCDPRHVPARRESELVRRREQRVQRQGRGGGDAGGARGQGAGQGEGGQGGDEVEWERESGQWAGEGVLLSDCVGWRKCIQQSNHICFTQLVPMLRSHMPASMLEGST